MDEDLKKAALAFHEFLRPGKVQITPTKPLATQYDLSLAYSPGVAAPCLEIEKDPSLVSRYTNRSNLVAVISNGTAVLGLGDIGPLAGKPVMEGKAVLFKKFAGIDVFDIEINEKDPDKIVDIIASLEPTFGGINLEDIKAPECFYIEAKIKERLKIPVIHDDQHGTAIIAAAAILNALEIVRKKIGDIKVVCSGAGAAAVACLNLLLALGIDKKNVVVCDSQGVIYEGRNKTLPPTKQKYAIKDDGRRTLGEVMEGSDLFLGLSGPDVLEAEMVKSMARDPIIMALANPEPEIWPPRAKAVRPDAIICTGRSDFPNQVNNVLCFPFIFRGALDVGATAINEEMKIASVHAIAKLAKAEASDLVKNAVGKDIAFGPEHVIPSPFDPRLIVDIASAVAKAAMDSGVATRPLEDLESYQAALTQYVYKTNLFMRPIFAKAKKDIKRVVLCNGEEERVLQATYSVVASGICKPILVGRREVIKARLQELRINLKIDEDFEIFNSDKDPRYDEYCETYYQLCKRRGITRQGARQRLVHAPTRVGALMLYRGEADALVCGTVGAFKEHFAILEEIIGYDNPEKIACAMNALMLSKGNVFITDTHVNEDPDALQIARITEMSARQMRSFGVKPKAALLSNSNYGSIPSAVSDKMKEALAIVHAEDPDLEVDGEMQGDVALVQDMRLDLMDDSPLQEGGANLLVMPNIYAANISHNLLRVSASDGVAIGPILMGMAKPCHILTPISSTRRIVNLCAIAAVDAQRYSHREKQGKL
ncbi:MAG: NADP-dependent malic enzyme [Haemophilus parainfluenzae]|nr:MAG: NADP-dependent malic enzyme [Haemophilus parainfluenzae]